MNPWTEAEIIRHPQEVAVRMQEIDALRAQNQRLIEALRGMVSIHDSVTMGQEREYRELHLPIARALLTELETDK